MTDTTGVAIRAIRSDDAPRLQAFHAGLSADTVRNRFFAPHPELSDADARRYCSLPVEGEVALVATAGDAIVAVARSIRLDATDTAEVAFVVADLVQGHGLGTRLLTLLSRVAWDDGIRWFVADTFAANRAMLGVFLHTGRAVTVESTRRDGSVIHLVMRLTPPGDLIAA